MNICVDAEIEPAKPANLYVRTNAQKPLRLDIAAIKSGPSARHQWVTTTECQLNHADATWAARAEGATYFSRQDMAIFLPSRQKLEVCLSILKRHSSYFNYRYSPDKSQPAPSAT